MCILIVLRGLHRDHPIVVAANRDERLDRPASPPGLFVGSRHRLLSPRDRRAGGTWLAIDALGRFAGITNIAGLPPVGEAPSRGHLPHVALDQPDLASAVAAVQARVESESYAGFQLVLCDGTQTVVLRHARGRLERIDWKDEVLVVTNEHPPGALHLHGLAAAAAPALDVPSRLTQFEALMKDTSGSDGHVVCKRGTEYGTVSSSLVAVPRDPLQLVWRYAPGSPDATPYRNYGNLGRRLLPDGPD